MKCIDPVEHDPNPNPDTVLELKSFSGYWTK